MATPAPSAQLQFLPRMAEPLEPTHCLACQPPAPVGTQELREGLKPLEALLSPWGPIPRALPTRVSSAQRGKGLRRRAIASHSHPAAEAFSLCAHTTCTSGPVPKTCKQHRRPTQAILARSTAIPWDVLFQNSVLAATPRVHPAPQAVSLPVCWCPVPLRSGTVTFLQRSLCGCARAISPRLQQFRRIHPRPEPLTKHCCQLKALRWLAGSNQWNQSS